MIQKNLKKSEKLKKRRKKTSKNKKVGDFSWNSAISFYSAEIETNNGRST